MRLSKLVPSGPFGTVSIEKDGVRTFGETSQGSQEDQDKARGLWPCFQVGLTA